MTAPGTSTHVSGNFRKMYAFKFLGEFYLIAPVLILYYTANGLNSTQIFTIQAAFHLSVLLLEVPSGYLADVIGRRKTLIVAGIFMPLGLAVYTIGRSFPVFVLAELTLAVSISMRSGCDSALIYDSLCQLGRQGEYKRIEGRAILFTRTGTALSSVAGGLLAVVFLRLPFLLNIFSTVFMLPLALSMAEPGRETCPGKNPWRDILRVCRFCLGRAQLRPLVLFSGLLMACQLAGVWAYFLHYRELGIGVAWFGILFAVFQLAGAWGGSRSHRFCERFGSKLPLFLALLSPLVFICLGLFPSPWLLFLVPVNAFLWNLAYPVLMERLNHAAGSDVRATVLSVAAMAGSVSFVIISPLFGRLVDAFSLSAAFIALGGFFLLAGAPLLAAMLRHWQEGGGNGYKIGV